jgi:hypothetical protein
LSDELGPLVEDEMNVGELKKMLEKYPDDMVVVSSRYSDYDVVEESDWSVVQAVPKDFYIMRAHPTMSEENMSKKQDFLYLMGN